MTIAVVQFTPLYGDIKSNLNLLLTLCSQAVKKGAKIIVLPEMAFSGYIWPQKNEIYGLAEPAKGYIFSQLSNFCSKEKVFLAYGFAEKLNLELFNSQNLIDDQGELLHTYRKKHLFEADQFWATPGRDEFASVSTKFGRLGLGICMDLNFDDFVLFHKNNSDIVLFSTNWIEENIDIHPYWIERWQGFKGTVAFANRCGTEFGIDFCGKSCFYFHKTIDHFLPKKNNDILLFSVPV